MVREWAGACLVFNDGTWSCASNELLANVSVWLILGLVLGLLCCRLVLHFVIRKGW